MRVVFLSLCWCFAFTVSAAVDLEKTMKNMGFQFKKAVETSESAQLLPLLDELITLTVQAQQANFPTDKTETYQRGLIEVMTQLESARAAALSDDMTLAHQHLREVDTLRTKYHKQRKVSVWRLLFGD